MRIFTSIIVAAFAAGLAAACDEGGSGSVGPGVGNNNSGATTGGAAVADGQETAGGSTAETPRGGDAGSTAGNRGAMNASGETRP